MMQRHIQFRVVLSSIDLEQFHSRLDRFELNITDAPAIRLTSRLQRSANWNEKHGGVCRQSSWVCALDIAAAAAAIWAVSCATVERWVSVCCLVANSPSLVKRCRSRLAL